MEKEEQYTQKQLKITCLTPKGKAKKSMNSLKESILGFFKYNKVDEQKILSDHEFYFKYTPKTEKEYNKVIKNAAKCEVTIKKFYSLLIRILSRCNKLANKSSWGLKKARNWVIKRLKKLYGDDKDNKFVKDIENQSDEEFKQMLNIEDIKDMQELLKKDLIKIE